MFCIDVFKDKDSKISDKILFGIAPPLLIIMVTGTLVFGLFSITTDMIQKNDYNNAVVEKIKLCNGEIVSNKNKEMLSDNFSGPYMVKLSNNAIEEVYVYYNMGADDFHVYNKDNRDQYSEVLMS